MCKFLPSSISVLFVSIIVMFAVGFGFIGFGFGWQAMDSVTINAKTRQKRRKYAILRTAKSPI